jgi:hypothetical protein
LVGAGEPGLVEEDHEGGGGQHVPGRGEEGIGPLTHRGAADGEGHLDRGAGLVERPAQGDRAGELELDRPPSAADGVEEGQQRREGWAVEAPALRVRVPGIQPRRIDGERPVGRDLDASEPPGRLRQHLLTGIARREGRRGGQLRQRLQDDIDRVSGNVEREAADGGRRARGHGEGGVVRGAVGGDLSVPHRLVNSDRRPPSANLPPCDPGP